MKVICSEQRVELRLRDLKPGDVFRFVDSVYDSEEQSARFFLGEFDCRYFRYFNLHNGQLHARGLGNECVIHYPNAVVDLRPSKDLPDA